jgi:germination protein M
LSRIQVKLLVVAIVTVVAVLVLILRQRDAYESAPAESPVDEELVPGVQSVQLAFADLGATSLRTERREIVVPEDSAGRAKSILKELARGPEAGGSVGTLPKGTVIRSVFFDGTGGVYVDFSRELIDNHPGGSAGELFTIRSIVRTLELNFPEIESVSFLVDGKEIETIAGHIDATVPFAVSQYR